MTRPAEESKLRIYVPAPGYEDDAEARALKAKLEEEFGLPAEHANMGRGADFPALLIELLSIGGSTLFVLSKGKEIVENLQFFADLFNKLKPFFKHRASFDRDGAYVLAINEIIKELGKPPNSIRLVGYKVGDRTGGGSDYDVVLTEIEEAPPSGYDDAHQFQFEIDGSKNMKAIVEGSHVTVIELPHAGN